MNTVKPQTKTLRDFDATHWDEIHNTCLKNCKHYIFRRKKIIRNLEGEMLILIVNIHNLKNYSLRMLFRILLQMKLFFVRSTHNFKKKIPLLRSKIFLRFCKVFFNFWSGFFNFLLSKFRVYKRSKILSRAYYFAS